MFEFSIIRRYLLPRRRFFSVSLISLMSVGVISLVVWLVLVFLSVTSGIEENWLKKLTSVSSPLRAVPTEHYHRSYYAQIDSLCESSNFSKKTIGEKRVAGLIDPFDPTRDRELPPFFPEKELLDPVSLLFSAVEELKEEFPSLAAGDYEMSGALMRIQVKRFYPSPYSSVVTQASYLLAPAEENPHLGELLAPMRGVDIENLFTQALRGNLEEKRWAFTTQNSWEVPKALWPKEGSVTGKFSADQEVFTIGKGGKETLQFSEAPPKTLLVSETTSFSVKEQSLDGVAVEGNVQGLSFKGALTPNELLPLAHKLEKSSERSPWSCAGELPRSGNSFPVLAPISLQNQGVAIGDGGQLLYSALSMTSVQEQRLPIYIAGFYDPGVIPTGNRCLLVPPEVTRTINSASPSLPIERELSNGVGIWLSPIKEAKKVEARLQEKLEEKGISSYWKIESFYDYEIAKELMNQFASDRYLFSLVGIIILVVACANVITLLLLLVTNKKKEMAILQAMGARKKSIALIFGGCGALMGVMSSAFGTLLAYLTLRNIDSIAKFLSFLQGREAFGASFYGSSLPDQMSYEALLFLAVATVILSFGAGLIPALKACRLRPVEILRSS